MAPPPQHSDASEKALAFFQELLRFRTVSFEGPKTGAYRACATWLVEKLSGLGLQTQASCGHTSAVH